MYVCMYVCMKAQRIARRQELQQRRWCGLNEMKGGHHIDIMNIIHDVLEFRRRADVRAQEAALFDSAHLLPLEARMCM